MSLKLITPATSEPVEYTEFIVHERIDDDPTQELDVRAKLLAARSFIERETCRALITSTWELSLERFPCSYIEVPLGNLQSVTSITYRLSDGTTQTLSPTLYRLSRTYTPADPPVVGDGVSDCGIGRIHPAYGQTWPSSTLDVGEPVVIRFVCGWDSAANVPTPLKAAINLYAGHLYRNREAVVLGNTASAISTPLAMALESLTSPYADRRF